MTFPHQRLQGMLVFLQRVSEEDEDVLEFLHVKDAFLQVPQEKPLKVVWRGEELLVKELEPKRGLTFSPQYFTEQVQC